MRRSLCPSGAGSAQRRLTGRCSCLRQDPRLRRTRSRITGKFRIQLKEIQVTKGKKIQIKKIPVQGERDIGRTALSGVRPRRHLPLLWLCVGSLLASLAIAAFVVLSFRQAPSSNTRLERFDTLLVLGAPAAEDGSIGIEQKWRMDESIREFRRGRAGRMIVSGGAVFNRFVEARAMADYAVREGIPPQDVLEEPASRNTVENIFNSQTLMDDHGWRSVEVVSSPEHLPRTALLLQYTHLMWRTHAAPTPGRGESDIVRHTIAEALATAAIRIFGLRSTSTLHRIKLRFGI